VFPKTAPVKCREDQKLAVAGRKTARRGGSSWRFGVKSQNKEKKKKRKRAHPGGG